MKNLHSGIIKISLLHLTVVVLLFSGCKKDIKEQNMQPGKSSPNNYFIEGGGRNNQKKKKENPLSLKKIKKIKSRNHNRSLIEGIDSIPLEQQLFYLKIDPNNLTTEVVTLLEADSTITVFDFPFAEANIYGNDFSLNEENVEELKEGYLYALVPALNDVFGAHDIYTTRLDTLYKPLQDEDPLVIQSLVDEGFITQEEADLRICFRRPEGFVRYTDSELGANQPVIRIQVTALFFGVPIRTHTNETGWFRIGWRFLFGTLITTKAVNDRVNIKPIVTIGILWPIFVSQQFVIGSVHIHGWVGSCSLNNININFTNHRQNRFWAHILNAVQFHDQFTQQDQILNAPQKITIWAHWADEYGGASAPMLGHIPNSSGSLIVQYISSLLGVDITNYQNIFNVLIGVLPDITLRSGSFDRPFYSSDQMQTAFHELGHASHYRVVGNSWWVDLAWAETFPTGGSQCPPYGCGNGVNDELIAVAESWAQFIGTTHALRRYPNGQMRSIFFLVSGFPNGLVRFDFALEYENWFANDWIPTGIYNDLRDSYNAIESWDIVQGATIYQLFSAFDPSIRSMCDYYHRFTQLYWTQFGFQPVLDIFNFHFIDCAL